MTKRKTPNTPQHAISELVALIGRDKAAEAIGKTASLIYGWENPDGDSYPNLIHAMQLDAECVRAKGRAPIHEYYAEMMERVAQGTRSFKQKIRDAVLGAATSVGRLADMAEKFTAPDSAGGEDFSPEERAMFLDEVRQLRLKLRKIEVQLEGDRRVPSARLAS